MTKNQHQFVNGVVFVLSLMVSGFHLGGQRLQRGGAEGGHPHQSGVPAHAPGLQGPRHPGHPHQTGL